MPDTRRFKDQTSFAGGSPANLQPASPSVASDTLTGKSNLLRMPRGINGDSDDPTDPPTHRAGISPAARRLDAKRGLVLYQFVDTDGDTRVVARRHGVLESDVKRTVARMLRPVVAKILREAA